MILERNYVNLQVNPELCTAYLSFWRGHFGEPPPFDPENPFTIREFDAKFQSLFKSEVTALDPQTLGWSPLTFE